MSKSPKTAIVIVNWNKKKDTLNLLNSLRNLEYDNHTILVVDNASTDGSVDAIRNRFPEAELLVNPENLGGTGGFNSGIRHVLKKEVYKYIWLLDNDVEVESDALKKLIDAMEEDEKIGLAGSRIVNPTNRNITVEAGAFVDTKMVGVKPLYGNFLNLAVDATKVEVDYVAVCSAVARVSSLGKAGLMDERYFIFWDDMDWGLSFKDSGYKVVCVLDSVAYHEAFTEKVSVLVDYYYRNRNSLLTYSKHYSLCKRAPLFYNYLRKKCTGLILLGFNGNADLMILGFSGIFDFIAGRCGKKGGGTNDNRPRGKRGGLPKRVNSILILNDGSRDEIYQALDCLKSKYPDARFTVLMNKHRSDYFGSGFDEVIEIDTGKSYSLAHLLSAFLRVLYKKFDVSVSFENSSPFLYTTAKSYVFDTGTKEFHMTDNNLWNLWKPALSTLLGEIMSLLLLPILYLTSLKYREAPGDSARRAC